MNYIDQVLYDFNGQLSINDIYHMTYKEIGYMRNHRRKLIEERGPTLGDLGV